VSCLLEFSFGEALTNTIKLLSVFLDQLFKIHIHNILGELFSEGNAVVWVQIFSVDTKGTVFPDVLLDDNTLENRRFSEFIWLEIST